MIAKIILWISLGGLVSIYAGYGIIMVLLNAFKSKVQLVAIREELLPEVAVLIAAFNEDEIIAAKIENTLALNYPADKLKVYVVSDGSSDRTNEIVSGYNNVSLLYQHARRGKSAAINRAMPFVQQPITIFTDANVMINKDAIRAIVNHYANPKVGGVSGEKVVMHDERAAAASTEGLYWKYE